MVREIMMMAVLVLVGLALLFPPASAAGAWSFYGTDKEGKHLYQKAKEGKESPGIVSVWDELIYSAEGRAAYIEKRKRYDHPVEGFGDVAYRLVLYELNCFSTRKEYALREVYEMDRAGKTLDYGRASGYRHWQDVPEGSIVELLHNSVCPAKRQ